MKRCCTATTRAGKPCRAWALTTGDKCLAHDLEAREKARFSGAQPGSGRPPRPRVVDVLRERIERDMEPVIAALIDALIAERGVVVGSGDDATVEFVADHAIRIAAARELLDRAYGKPRQATEVTGPDGGPITLTVPTDGADRAARAAQLLATAGAIPGSTNGNGHHNGNGRH